MHTINSYIIKVGATISLKDKIKPHDIKVELIDCTTYIKPLIGEKIK